MKKLFQSLKQWRLSRWFAALFLVTAIAVLPFAWAAALVALGWAIMYALMDYQQGNIEALEKSRAHWIDWGTECLELSQRVSKTNIEVSAKAKEVYNREYNCKVRSALREIFGAEIFNEK